MNLCGNALKYTSEGFVSVKLEVIPNDTLKKHNRVILTVTDSGKGMSQEYLRTRLFTPFAQEDPLLPGTGLGLSIVKQIVVGMGGDISVNSEVGRGTEVRVEAIFRRSPQASLSRKPSVTSLVAERSKGLKAGFFGSNEDAFIDPESLPSNDCNSRAKENTRSQFFGTLKRLFQRWFKMDLIMMDSLDQLGGVDVLITTGADAAKIKEQMGHGLGDRSAVPPILVLCDSALGAQRSFAANQMTESGDVVDFLPQPFGPRKLARALAIAFDRKASQQTSSPPVWDADAVKDLNGHHQSISQPRAASDESKSIPERNNSFTIGRRSSPTAASTRSVPSSVSTNAGPDNSDTTSSTRSVPWSVSTYQDPPSGSATPTGEKNGLHLLLVDDNKINLLILERYLKAKKHSYMTAADGLEALETYMTVMSKDVGRVGTAEGNTLGTSNMRGFDIVLTDISMPRMDGLESTRRIRAFEKANGLKATTIIALTGLASAASQQEAYSSGVDLFLTKPVRLKELAEILKERTKGAE